MFCSNWSSSLICTPCSTLCHQDYVFRKISLQGSMVETNRSLCCIFCSSKMPLADRESKYMNHIKVLFSFGFKGCESWHNTLMCLGLAHCHRGGGSVAPNLTTSPNFSALPVPGREPEGVRGEVDSWPRFWPPLTLLKQFCVLCRLEESQRDNPRWTILNIKQGSGYGLKARNLRYDQFTM